MRLFKNVLNTHARILIKNQFMLIRRNIGTLRVPKTETSGDYFKAS